MTRSKPKGNRRRFVRTHEWFEYHDKVVALGRWLLANDYTAEELQAFYEAPWKYTPEWERYSEHADYAGG